MTQSPAIPKKSAFARVKSFSPETKNFLARKFIFFLVTNPTDF